MNPECQQVAVLTFGSAALHLKPHDQLRQSRRTSPMKVTGGLIAISLPARDFSHDPPKAQRERTTRSPRTHPAAQALTQNCGRMLASIVAAPPPSISPQGRIA